MSTRTRKRAVLRNGPKGQVSNGKQNAQPFFDSAPKEPFFAAHMVPAIAHRKCEECEKEEKQGKKLQKAENQSSKSNAGSVVSYINSLPGKGSSLPESSRKFFEPKFKADFSKVRVHADKESAEAASAINAKAFTYKNHIVFNQGQYDAGSTTGRKLLAHELTHVIQQDNTISRMEVEKPEEEKLQRKPDLLGVIKEDFSYSTHCGWIDWGHANPTLARKLIAALREASSSLQKKDDELQKKITLEMPTFTTDNKCPTHYDAGEMNNSYSEAPVEKVTTTPSGAREIRLGGLGVGNIDMTKFSSRLKEHASWATTNRPEKEGQVELRIGGMTDCMNVTEWNSARRFMRSVSAYGAFMEHVTGKSSLFINQLVVPLNQFLESNASREGRKWNRGIVIQIIPHAGGEVKGIPAMETSRLGVSLSRAVPVVNLDKPLTETEIIAASLTTFLLQSHYFEITQQWADWFSATAFSEEDLVSNLLGFYRAVKGYSNRDIEKFCDTWPTDRSVEKFGDYSFQKNRTFRPLHLPPGGAWPSEFSTLQPMPMDAEYFSILLMLMQKLGAFNKEDWDVSKKCKVETDGSKVTC